MHSSTWTGMNLLLSRIREDELDLAPAEEGAVSCKGYCIAGRARNTDVATRRGLGVRARSEQRYGHTVEMAARDERG